MGLRERIGDNMKIIEKIYDVETGEENIIEREETLQEKKLREKAEAETALRISEMQKKAEAKAALFERLGITEEEAKLLLG